MMPAVDAHHHLWRYSPDEYEWIGDDMAVLRQDFLVESLQDAASLSGVVAAVVVQARQMSQETKWLLSLAEKNSLIAGVVGWADLRSATFAKQLDELVTSQKLVGLRHVVQGEKAGFLQGAAFHEGISLLRGTRLVYDILIHEHQLQEATHFVDRHPHQRFVLDHAAKPRIASGQLEPWRTQIKDLAQRPNVVCKISGLVTEAVWETWSMTDLRPYVEVLLEAFGVERLMIGSDWPVCLVASGYSRWWTTMRDYLSALTKSQQHAVLYQNAITTYGLTVTL